MFVPYQGSIYYLFGSLNGCKYVNVCVSVEYVCEYMCLCYVSVCTSVTHMSGHVDVCVCVHQCTHQCVHQCMCQGYFHELVCTATCANRKFLKHTAASGVTGP